MLTVNHIDYSLLASENEGGATSTMSVQKDLCLSGEVNSITAVEQLLTIHSSYDTARVDSPVNAFQRFTPAFLLCISEEYLDRFLVEMSLVYDAGADLRDVRASFHGCSLPFTYWRKRAVMEIKYLQP